MSKTSFPADKISYEKIMIELKQCTLSRGSKIILQQASLRLHPRQKVGIIGKNGVGKSTLFAALQAEILPDAGDVSVPQHWKIAHLSQETPALDCAALDYVLDGDRELRQLQAALKIAEDANDGEAIARMHEALTQIDAWSAPARAARLLSGLGFAQHEHGQAVKHFSGGWRMRLNLAQALQSRADLLLLDEPTNHLDLEAVLWLQDFLQSLDGTLLLISHDRDFLDQVCSHIVEISEQKTTLYTGNYSAFERLRAEKLAQNQALAQAQQKKRAHLEQFIRRFQAKASKAKQAQSRIKALAKLEVVAAAQADSPFAFQFCPPEKMPHHLLRLDDVALGFSDTPLLQNINLGIDAGARIGLLGQNGVGKSSLIKLIAGELLPLSGQITRAKDLKIGYFAQHQLEILREDQSPLWHLQQLAPQAKEQELRNFLGGFHFHGEVVTEAIAHFSGGEKARLALALLIWQKPNLLLLDEPTNHLDLDMRAALSLALQDFTGALLLVSHDRALLEENTDSFWRIDAGRVLEFSGDLNQYRELCMQSKKNIHAANKPDQVDKISRKDQKRQEAEQRQALAAKKKPLEQEKQNLEKRIDALKIQLHDIEAFLADEANYQDAQKTALQSQLRQQADAARELETLENRWLEIEMALEEMA